MTPNGFSASALFLYGALVGAIGCSDEGMISGDPCRDVACSGHGACEVLDAEASCACEAGYHAYGLSCVADGGSDPCAGVTCSGHGVCSDTGDGIECVCDDGFRVEGLGCVAEEASACEGVTCSGHGSCDDSGADPVCVCDEGFSADGLDCVADNPTSACQGVTCSGHGSCDDSSGQAECACDQGYSADGLDCVADNPPARTTLFDNDFETGNLDGWRCSGNCPQIATSPVLDGRYAGNFTLTRSMATSYRTEAVFDSPLRFAFGEEYWMVLRYRYEDWAPDHSAEAAPFQIHTTPSDWGDPTCSLGSAYSTAPFLMVSVNNTARFVTYGGRTLWEAPVVLHQWMTIEVHFKISSRADGFIEAWHDGQFIGRVDGRNNQGDDGCGQPQRDPFFKMGVYKWDWREGRPDTDSSRRQLMIDGTTIYRRAQ